MPVFQTMTLRAPNILINLTFVATLLIQHLLQSCQYNICRTVHRSSEDTIKK